MVYKLQMQNKQNVNIEKNNFNIYIYTYIYVYVYIYTDIYTCMYVCIYRERKLYLELRFHKAEFVKEEKWKTLSLVAVFRERK